MLGILAAGAITGAVLVGCSGDEEPALTLVSFTADDVDINGASSAVGVSTGATLVATFNVDLDPNAVSGIILTRSFDEQVLDAEISINGKEVTIDPAGDFSTGSLISIAFDNTFKSKGGNTLKFPIERTFTTEGTFAVPGAIAHWTFEDTGVDIIGGRGPGANGTVAVTYETGRKADAGKAASFNGTTSIMEIPNGDQLMNNGDWALSLWVKPNSTLGKGQFVIGLGAFYGFQMEINGSYSNFKLAAGYTNGTTDYSEDMWADGTGNLGWQGWTYSKDFGATTMSPNIKDVWAHYAFVYDAAQKTGTVYLNGEKVKSQDFDNWPNNDPKYTTTGLKWRGDGVEVVKELAFGFIQSRAGTLWDAEPWGGYAQTGANHFHGLLDDVIIYHKVITAGEVAAMYNSGKP